MPQPSPLLPSDLPHKIDSLPCDELATAANFLRRKARKMSAAGFLKTACLFALGSSPSLATFAKCWAFLHGDTLSKQAVAKRCSAAAVAFLESILQHVLVGLLDHSPRPGLAPSPFARILLQDSTTLPLSPRLAGLFPGASNQSAVRQASLKIQATLDLLHNRWICFKITPFTSNDQSASSGILEQLHAGDLVIRDLGYFVLGVFRQIHDCGAYFLSRWRHGLRVALPGNPAPLDLLGLLRGLAHWDGSVLLGEDRLPARLIAVRLPEAQAAQRRRKARADRDKRLRHDPGYYELLGWNIFVTNVPVAMASLDVLTRLYSLRWRIEIIFKAWKSHFRMEQLTNASAQQILIVVVAKLIWICWFTVQFNELWVQGLKVSVLKLADWWSKYALSLFRPDTLDPDTVGRIIRYYSRYDRRRDRHQFFEKLESILG